MDKKLCLPHKRTWLEALGALSLGLMILILVIASVGWVARVNYKVDTLWEERAGGKYADCLTQYSDYSVKDAKYICEIWRK